MKREVVDCDACGAKTLVAPVTARIEVGYEQCPSGNGGSVVEEVVDLCPACAARAISTLAKNGRENAVAWLKKFMNGKRGAG